MERGKKERRSKSEEEIARYWERFLSGTEPTLRLGRSGFRFLPSSPRCKFCLCPFSGPGGALMRLIGKGPWNRNPQLCRMCSSWLARRSPGGAEVYTSLLFADIRGSTELAERMTPSEYSRLISRFFEVAADAFVHHGGITDQLVGDEAIGLFLPGYAGPLHARQAVEAAQMLLSRTGHGEAGGPWVPVGVGIHTGVTYIGSVGSSDAFSDFTAIGDSVNTTARLASAAGAGEILISETAQSEAKIDAGHLEHRSLRLKGKAEPVDVLVCAEEPRFL